MVGKDPEASLIKRWAYSYNEDTERNGNYNQVLTMCKKDPNMREENLIRSRFLSTAVELQSESTAVTPTTGMEPRGV
jgi:hypothetical protein